MQAFLNAPEDMDWLFEVHLPYRRDHDQWQSAVIHGNEDCPERIELYASADPLYTDQPEVICPTETP